MSLTIDLSSQVKILPAISNEVNAAQNVPAKAAKMLSAVHLEPRQTSLNKETIVQLQGAHELTILQISSKKDDIDFNGVPRLEWLKGRDNKLYNEMVGGLSRGDAAMKKFAEIVERNKNNDIISHEDWRVIKYSISCFELGAVHGQRDRAQADDPIVHKVLDYIGPKTQQRIDALKQFLVSKVPGVVIPNNLNVMDDFALQVQTGSSSNDLTALLNFLAKDLQWYKWYLEDKEDRATTYSLQFFQLSYSKTVCL